MSVDTGARLCSIEGCMMAHMARGFCTTHYRHWRKESDPNWGARTGPKPGRTCETCGIRPSGYYLNCKSCRFKADKDPCPKCGRPKTRVAKTCIDCRPRPTGPEHPAWKGGLPVVDRDGYAKISSPGHPKANGSGQYVKEHVLVMEKRIGRYLLPGENVHHLNGVRDDNRIENLELWSTSQPPGQRVSDKLSWAREIIATYAGFPDFDDRCEIEESIGDAA